LDTRLEPGKKVALEFTFADPDGSAAAVEVRLVHRRLFMDRFESLELEDDRTGPAPQGRPLDVVFYRSAIEIGPGGSAR